MINPHMTKLALLIRWGLSFMSFTTINRVRLLQKDKSCGKELSSMWTTILLSLLIVVTLI